MKDIIISGVMTNCCVETTARSAFYHDYGVFVVADACAAVDDELHTATLKNLAYGFAYVVDTKRMLDFLDTQKNIKVFYRHDPDLDQVNIPFAYYIQ